ncbi:MAG: DUF1097 domain-containing protein [Pontibacterium sp.]
MNTLNALTVSIALLGALATYLALGPLGGMFLIWVAFIAWGGFYAFGADTAALKNLVVCGIFGAVVAWAVAVVILSLPFADQIGLPLWAAIAVGAGIVVVVLAANIPALATIPATVFGFAASFGYLLQTADVLNLSSLLSVSLQNSLVIVSISLVVGGLFGLVSAQLAGKLTAAS